MVLFNYSTKELTAKVVFYGPGLCGKTTNLQFIHENLPDDVRGKMLSLATKTDRTLFFDFLPIDLGSIRGMKTRVQLYTVPGQVFYNETRKLVLKGADGIVFVADSQESMLGANIESFRNLEDNLKAHGMILAEMPHVLQFNKRDLPRLSSIEEINSGLNKFNAPFYESVATTGIGVQDTLKAIVKLVLLHLTRKYDPTAQPSRAKPVAVVAPPTPVPVPAAAATQAIPLSNFDTPVDATRSVPVNAMPEPISGVAKAPPPPDFQSTTAGSVPPPPDFHGHGAVDSKKIETPEFDVEEIDELVDEVEELEEIAVAPDSMEIDEQPLAASSPDDRPLGGVDQQDLGGPASVQFAKPSGATDGVGVTAPPPSFGVDTGSEAMGAQDLTADRGKTSGDNFQIDRGFDPEWDDDPALNETNDTLLDTAGKGPEPGSAPSRDEPVVLTELASDADLFDDPDVEVARLDGTEDREIVVPVEVGKGASKRRFKLSIRLHLDAVD
jgi:signal recognition particle receptor subunit beta